jgi:hypothetical protein
MDREQRARQSGSGIDFGRFADITYEAFRRRAMDPGLTSHEKIGFPDAYREGFEELIFDDIASKLTRLRQREQVVMDIGAGGDRLGVLMVEHSAVQGHRLIQVDSPEMLALLPEAPRVERVPGRFPDECEELLAALGGGVHCVLAYGVLSSVYAQANIFDFVDRAAELLEPGGQLLLGDLPNVSMRRRFFASDAGVRFHQGFMDTLELPVVEFNAPAPGAIDDAVILAIVSRCRAAGYNAYVLPLDERLPLANRREDILITRP